MARLITCALIVSIFCNPYFWGMMMIGSIKDLFSSTPTVMTVEQVPGSVRITEIGQFHMSNIPRHGEVVSVSLTNTASVPTPNLDGANPLWMVCKGENNRIVSMKSDWTVDANSMPAYPSLQGHEQRVLDFSTDMQWPDQPIAAGETLQACTIAAKKG